MSQLWHRAFAVFPQEGKEVAMTIPGPLVTFFAGIVIGGCIVFPVLTIVSVAQKAWAATAFFGILSVLAIAAAIVVVIATRQQAQDAKREEERIRSR
jgi:hypothetical protein